MCIPGTKDSKTVEIAWRALTSMVVDRKAESRVKLAPDRPNVSCTPPVRRSAERIG